MDSLRTTSAFDSPIYRVNPRDNVAVAAVELRAGQTFAFEGRELRASDAISTGHKVAVARIAAGEKVIKHGGPIGSATRDILPGEHVHAHNLKSDYLPTFTLGGTNSFLHRDSCKAT